MSQNKEKNLKNNSQKSSKKMKFEKADAKRGNLEKIGKSVKKIGKANVNFRLPDDLKTKIESEKQPDEVVSIALAEYYSGLRKREELAVQREIDNNIIEVQRRHISDLKDQLAASNRNYEELIRIHQAYMLQVQPLIENAKKPEIESSKPESKTEPEPKFKSQTPTEKPGAGNLDDAAGGASENAVPADLNKQEEPKPDSQTAAKKKWYQFWK
ncbi:hypothetical protein MsAg5_18030 [Methanosarcinaceae archaeon Ag5]|uniref:Uncharacterized protein n=1 Tax=Methanolapillus africanus TaxID=3028297 RepID=A0AAE4MKH5_9EURY|nr:hypothetical protein [Methanosarcinaceae archaeon Ag5]